MAIIKCKMCGGDIELSTDKTYGTCDSCGSTMTFPKVSDEQRANLFNRANHFRRQNEFDKAVSAYERILDEDNTDAEAHWGVVLSRYGIEYVEDPATRERIPTCHRVQLASILTDADYLAALEYAPDGGSRALYEQEATRIAEIQKDILAISNQEKPYDVFICYKETTDGGSRTKDSALAQDIYYQLTQDGYKVFFSRITLEDKLGQQYEPYIFAALNSARVMVVVGTKPEHFSAVWVKNEWSRYLALMKQDRSRLLIPCYRDMDAYDLPDELSALQSQDMGKIGFMQDLIRGIKKVLEGGNEQKPIPEQAHAPGVTSLLKRAHLFLEDGDFASADEYAEKVLDIDPECAEAYLVKTLVTYQVYSESELAGGTRAVGNDPNYLKALRFASEDQKKLYFGYEETIQNNIRVEQTQLAYQHAMTLYQTASNETDLLKAAEAFSKLGDYKDAPMMQRELEARAMQEHVRQQQEQEVLAAKQAQLAQERKRKEEQQRIEDEKRRSKNRKLVAVLSVAMALVLCAGLAVKFYLIPKSKYDVAVEMLYAQQSLSQETLSLARESFLLAGDYSDAAQKVEQIDAYQAAVEMMQEDTQQARIQFSPLLGFLNADELYLECCQSDYMVAQQYLEANDIAAAYALFVELNDYADSRERVESIEQAYQAAGELLNARQYDEAAVAYEQLGNYADSQTQWYKASYQKAEALLGEGLYDEATAQFEMLGADEQAQASKAAAHAARIQQAQALLADGYYDEAIVRLTQLNETEHVLAAHYAKAEALQLAGDYSAAEKEWELAADFNDAENRLYALRVDMAAEALNKKEYGVALDYYLKMEQTDEVKAMEYTLAQSAYDSGAYNYATAAYEVLGQYELSLSRLPIARYAYAKQLFDSENYQQAQEQYALLGDFADSVQWVQKSGHQYARQLMASGMYAEAQEVLEPIYDYLDAGDLLKECTYQTACALMEEGRLEEARVLFRDLGEYSNSHALSMECDYLVAEEWLAKQEYAKAQSIYDTLAFASYKDSAAKLQLCVYEQANQYFTNGRYAEAKQLYASIPEYQGTDLKVKECILRIGTALYQSGDYTGAMELLQGLNYADSDQLIAACHCALGKDALAMGRFEKAVREYLQAADMQEAKEKLYGIGKDFVVVAQMEKAIETLYLSSDYEPAKDLLLELAKQLETTGDSVTALTAYLAAEKAENFTEAVPFEHFQQRLDLFVLCENADEFRNPLLYRYAYWAKANGQYADAEAAFGKLGDYQEAAAQLLEVKYQRADLLYADGKAAEAMEVFMALADYSDATERVKKIQYEFAEKALEAGEYDEASACFAAAGDYSDAADRVKEPYYRMAEKLLEEGKPQEAIGVFQTLGAYADAPVRIQMIHYTLAEQALTQGEYEKASQEFAAAGDYLDAAERVLEPSYQEALSALQKGQSIEARRIFDALGEYRDSAEQVKACIYASAEQAYEAGQFEQAEALFSEIPDYLDAETKIAESQARQINPGTHILFGRWEQDDDLTNGLDPIEWIVLDRQDNRVLVITKDIFYGELIKLQNGVMGFVASYEAVGDDPTTPVSTACDWENSTTRKYLNSSFMDVAFTQEERSAIPVVTVKEADHPTHKVVQVGHDTQDQIFILSYDEVQQYMPTLGLRKSQVVESQIKSWPWSLFDERDVETYNAWILRQPVRMKQMDKSLEYIKYIVGISVDGILEDPINGNYVEGSWRAGYRPVCWIDLDLAGDMLMFPQEELVIETYAVGTDLQLGHFEQDGNIQNGAEPIEWEIVHREGNRALLLSKHVLQTMRYSRSKTFAWEKSEIRSWLNESFLQTAFSQQENSVIAQRIIRAETAHAGAHTQDKVFILSRTEVENYLPDEKARIAKATAYATQQQSAHVNENAECRWWLRSSASSSKYADNIKQNGSFGINEIVDSTQFGIRPAIWVNLDMLVGEEEEQAEQPEALSAETQDTPDAETKIAESQARQINPGTHILFGRWEQDDDLANGLDPIEWIVLDRQDNRILVITKDIYAGHETIRDPYGHEYSTALYMAIDENMTDNQTDDCDWENSMLRKYLNSSFVDVAFTQEERSAIPVVTVKEAAHPTHQVVQAGHDTQDQIFILSYDEVQRYMPTLDLRKSQFTEAHENKLTPQTTQFIADNLCFVAWVLRQPLRIKHCSKGYDETYLAVITNDGNVADDYYMIEYGCRPVCWIDLDLAGDVLMFPQEEALIETYAVGADLQLGHFEQDGNMQNGAEPIEWEVIHRDGNRALLLSKHVLWTMRYNSSKTFVWEKSEIRSWLNESFLQEAFSQPENSVIAQRTILAETAHAGANTQDKVFILSRTEVENYLPDEKARIAKATAYATQQQSAHVNENGDCRWWLRSSASSTKYADNIKQNGSFGISEIVDSTQFGIRPAIWVNLDAETFEAVIGQ